MSARPDPGRRRSSAHFSQNVRASPARIASAPASPARVWAWWRVGAPPARARARWLALRKVAPLRPRLRLRIPEQPVAVRAGFRALVQVRARPPAMLAPVRRRAAVAPRAGRKLAKFRPDLP